MPTEDRLSPENADVPFSATVAPDDVFTVVRLHGELDMATEQKLARVLDEALATTPGVVRMDLSDVTFCDARGLAALLVARERLWSAQRGLVLTGVPRVVQRLLEVAGVKGPFNVG